MIIKELLYEMYINGIVDYPTYLYMVDLPDYVNKYNLIEIIKTAHSIVQDTIPYTFVMNVTDGSHMLSTKGEFVNWIRMCYTKKIYSKEYFTYLVHNAFATELNSIYLNDNATSTSLFYNRRIREVYGMYRSYDNTIIEIKINSLNIVNENKILLKMFYNCFKLSTVQHEESINEIIDYLQDVGIINADNLNEFIYKIVNVIPEIAGDNYDKVSDKIVFKLLDFLIDNKIEYSSSYNFDFKKYIISKLK